ncbi:MAG: hypothetical protein AB7I41_17110 [Candidatus Sericytochromatia bacterium]
MEILFIPSQYHLDHLLKTAPHLLKNKHVLAYDFNVGSYCYDHQIPHSYFQNYLIPKEQDECEERGFALSQAWTENFQADCFWDGIDLCQMISRDMWRSLIAVMIAQKLVPRLLKDLKPSKIFIFNEVYRPDYFALPNTYYPDEINAVLLQHAVQSSLPIQYLEPPIATDDHSSLIYHILSQISRPFRSGPKLNGMPSISSIINLQRPKNIFIIGYFMEIYDQIELHEDLIKNPDYQLIFISMQNTPVFEHTPGFLKLDFRHFKHWPFPLQAYYQKIDHIKQRYYQQNLATGNWKEHLEMPFYHFQLDFFFNSLKDAARTVEGMKVLLHLFQPVLSLAGGSSNFGNVRTAIETLRHHGVSALNIMHGALRGYFWDRYQLIPADCYAVRGLQSREDFLNRNLNPPQRVEVIGDMRGSLPEAPQENMHQSPASLDLQNFSQGRPLTLIVTAILNSGLLEMQGSLQGLQEDWNYLIALAEKRDDLCFAIKPHPGYDYHSYYQRLADKFKNIYYIDKSITIKDVLTAVSECVLLNVYSSAVLECSMAQKPVIILRSSTYRDIKITESGISRSDKITILTDIQDLEPVINKIHSNPDFRTNLIQRGNEFCEDYTSETGKTIDKLTLVAELSNESAPLNTDDEKKHLGQLLLALSISYYMGLFHGQDKLFQETVSQVLHLFQGEVRTVFETYLTDIQLT